MNSQILLQILYIFNVWFVVRSAGQRRDDFIITDTRQIPNLNPNEKAALGQIISTLGGKDVEITVIEQRKPQPQNNFYSQPQYGYPNQGRPFVGNNRQPQIDIIEVYTDGAQYGNNNFQRPGPPAHAQYPGRPTHAQYPGPPPHSHSPNSFSSNNGRYPDLNEQYPPSRDRYPSQDDRYPTSHDRYPSSHRPTDRYPPPPHGEHQQELEDDNRSHSSDNHHHHHHHHHDHHNDKPDNQNPSRREPPPRPVYDEDDPRVDGDEKNDDLKRLSEDSHKIVYPDSYKRETSSQQYNINLSELHNKRNNNKEDGGGDNVAGYINDFPVIFLKKDEIRK